MGTSRTVAATAGVSNIAWSPDGSKIAFMRFADEIWLVGRDGSGARKLLEAEFVGAPSWSPDSNHIAVRIDEKYPEKPSRIVVVDVLTGYSRELTSSEFGEGSDAPSWSPDGSRIAYERERIRGEHDRDIWITNADGNDNHKVTDAFPLGTGASGAEWVPGLIRIEPDPGIPDAVDARPSRVAQLAAPVERLEADERRAVFLGAGFGVWSAKTGRIRAQRGACEAVVDLAIAGTRIAWACEEQGLSFCADTLKTATLVRPRPRDVARLNYCELSVAGRKSLIVYSTGRKIWRLDGSGKHLAWVDRTIARVLSVDAGRVLLQHKDASLEVASAAGRSTRIFRLARQPEAAELSGDRVVVLERTSGTARLQVLRLRDGKPIHSWGLPNANEVKFQSAYGALATYVVGIALHVINLSDGRDVVLRFPQQAGETHARLVERGLFYSHGEAYTARSGRLGFIPRSRLVELLR
jgi:hypothetical protein